MLFNWTWVCSLNWKGIDTWLCVPAIATIYSEILLCAGHIKCLVSLTSVFVPLRYHSAITVSYTPSGGGPIRKCAC
jgi:hypothetical protein